MLALSVKPVLLTVPALVLTLLSTGVAQAADFGMGTGFLLQTLPALECYPVPNQSGGPLDGLPPASINPVDWIGWVLGQLCKAIATVFFSLTNQVINWGTGCSQAGINFVTQTPNYIRLDGSKAGNWQLFFWDGSFIGAALLLQFTWTALAIIWNRQLGNGYAGAQEAITRALLGGFLLLISATVLDWVVSFCNLLNGLFASRLSLFDPKSFQVDTNGNIFNTILSMAAALASLLLVMQMATRYIYLILLQFIFPVGSILWINRGTQNYARLLFTSFVATLFVQPLQLAAIYITSNLKDGTRDDTSLSMLFGICGLFLVLGLPRVMGSVLGGSTPVGAWGIFAISRMAAGGISSAVRSSSRGGNSGGGGNGNGSRGPSPSGGSGGSGSGGGRGGSNGAGMGSPVPSATGAGRNSQNTSASSAAGASDTPTGADESLRYGGVGQAAFRKSNSGNSTNRNEQASQNYQSSAPSSSNNAAGAGVTTASETSPTNAKSPSDNGNNGIRPLPLTSQSGASGNLRADEASDVRAVGSGTGQTLGNPNSNGSAVIPASGTNGSFSLAQASGNGGGGERVEPTTIYRNKNGLMPRGELGKDSAGGITPTSTERPHSDNAPGSTTSNASTPLMVAGREELVGRQTMSRVSRSRPTGYRPATGRPRLNRREDA